MQLLSNQGQPHISGITILGTEMCILLYLIILTGHDVVAKFQRMRCIPCSSFFAEKYNKPWRPGVGRSSGEIRRLNYVSPSKWKTTDERNLPITWNSTYFEATFSLFLARFSSSRPFRRATSWVVLKCLQWDNTGARLIKPHASHNFFPFISRHSSVCMEITLLSEQLKDSGLFPAGVKIFSTEGSNRFWDHPVQGCRGVTSLTSVWGLCYVWLDKDLHSTELHVMSPS